MIKSSFFSFCTFSGFNLDNYSLGVSSRNLALPSFRKFSLHLGKRGDANMWWIIIGAVIALIVMIVLLVMFTGKTGGLEAGLSACEGKSGICVASGEKPPLNTVYSSVFECEQENKCYVGSPKKCTSGNDAACGKGN